MFHDIITILGVGFEGDFSITLSAFEVEAINSNAEVIFIQTGFLSHVELCANIKIIAAGGTTQTHGKHHTNIILLIFGTLVLNKTIRIEIWGVIFDEDLAFGHFK
jgi:hypothetical protein